MKKSLLIIALLGVGLAACSRQEIPPRPAPTPGTVELENTYGAEIRTVKMEDGVTCYIVTRDGVSSISCLRK